MRARADVEIAPADDFAGIIDGIYRVRCNLLHGTKRPGNTLDVKLVLACSRILEKWMGTLCS